VAVLTLVCCPLCRSIACYPTDKGGPTFSHEDFRPGRGCVMLILRGLGMKQCVEMWGIVGLFVELVPPGYGGYQSQSLASPREAEVHSKLRAAKALIEFHLVNRHSTSGFVLSLSQALPLAFTVQYAVELPGNFCEERSLSQAWYSVKLDIVPPFQNKSGGFPTT